MRRPRLFTVFYSTTFSILSLFLAILLLVTPADSIYQAFQNHQLYNLAAIGAVYFITAVCASLIYASRLYTNRSVLAAIPKSWVPLEKGDLGGRRMARVVREGLVRSLGIAKWARPRDLSNEIVTGPPAERGRRPTSSGAGSLSRTSQDRRRGNGQQETVISVPPVWGNIAHPGHSPSGSQDLPDLHYETVILELPHLIEAKAVSLAPLLPSAQSQTDMPDLRALDLLQRPATMGLREYILHLVSLDVVDSPDLARDFLTQYEYARFSGNGLTEEEFKALMKTFSSLLREMTPLPENWVEQFTQDYDDNERRSIHSGSGGTSISSKSSYTSVSSLSGSARSTSSSPGGASIRRSMQTTPHLAGLPVRPSRHQRKRTISARQTPPASHLRPTTAPPRTPSPRKHSSNTIKTLGLGLDLNLTIPRSSSSPPPPRSLTPSPAPSRSPQSSPLHPTTTTETTLHNTNPESTTTPNTSLRPSQTWDTVVTPGGNYWVGPPPLPPLPQQPRSSPQAWTPSLGTSSQPQQQYSQQETPPAFPSPGIFGPDVERERQESKGGRRRGDSAGTFG